MKEILGTLVALPTVTEDREANNLALDFVSDYLSACGMHIEKYEFNGVRSMVATTRPRAKDSKVMLACHLDVVPANCDSDFRLYQDGDKLYGRGTLDMKFAAAANLSIVKDLANEGKLSQYDIALAFTTTEERGGYDDTEKLLEAEYRPQVCILPDGGDDWQLQISSKGFLHFKVDTEGVTAHSSAPWKGKNAIEQAFEVNAAIRSLFPENMGPDTNSVSLNMISGGQAVNQVPQSTEMRFDTRYISPEEQARVRAELSQICMDHGAKLTVLTDGAPAIFDINSHYIAPFARLVHEVTGIEVNGSKTLGSSDARFYAAKGIPVISLYPTGGGHHSDGEWISERALSQYKTVVRSYLDEIACVPISA